MAFKPEGFKLFLGYKSHYLKKNILEFLNKKPNCIDRELAAFDWIFFFLGGEGSVSHEL